MGWRVAALLAAALAAAAGAGRPAGGFRAAREAMVREQIAARGVRDPAVLEAMRRVPRHLFVPVPYRPRAYGDHPLPIAGGQTISQPFIVAYMTEALGLGPGDKVLEVGTGSGYQAAVLARVAGEVFSIEIDPDLAREASALLAALGCSTVRVRAGDGFHGWPEEAPFDAVIVTCAAPRVPPALLEQLAEGGRLILPLALGPMSQTLTLVTKRNGKPVPRELLDVLFVPMTGEIER